MDSYHRYLYIGQNRRLERNPIFLFALFLLALVYPPLLLLSVFVFSTYLSCLSPLQINLCPDFFYMLPESPGARAPPF